MTNEWTNPEHAQAYLKKLTDIPHRAEGEATLLSEIPPSSRRVLDLGCGNGHLLSLVLAHCPSAIGVGLDFSPTMVQQAEERFAGDDRVTLVEHNMDTPLPDLGSFDCIVSSFAIHHCTDARKRELYTEVFSLLELGGVFCNLEHVSSPNQRIHNSFLDAMGMTPDDEDPSNKLLDVETQLQWLREIGFDDVDCHWKWRELALIAGRRNECLSPSSANMRIDDEPSVADVALLDNQIEVFNRQQTGRDDFHPLHLVMRDSQGKVIAGLKSVTGWDWLYVQVLWVGEQCRRQGTGSQLLERAEQEARTRRCVGACLSTYSFQAPEFYQRHGYSVFGQIDEYPRGQSMYFLSKRFDEGKGVC